MRVVQGQDFEAPRIVQEPLAQEVQVDKTQQVTELRNVHNLLRGAQARPSVGSDEARRRFYITWLRHMESGLQEVSEARRVAVPQGSHEATTRSETS